MFQIDLKSRKAIYEQVADNFKRLIVTGVLKENDKVPSIREMAKTLTVNPNTVQKAYRELESQGYFYTVLGQGNFIAAPAGAGVANEIGELYERLRHTTQALLFLGETEKTIVRFVGDACAAMTAQDHEQDHKKEAFHDTHGKSDQNL